MICFKKLIMMSLMADDTGTIPVPVAILDNARLNNAKLA